jgi:arylsulfatase A-like enzyme
MNHMLHPELGERSLFQVLKDAGYFIWWGGKNDVFDSSSSDGGRAYCDVRFGLKGVDVAQWGGSFRQDPHSDQSWRPSIESDDFYSMHVGCLDKGSDPHYLDSDWCTVLAARDFINRYEGEQPLCIMLTLGYPHPPYAVEEPFFSQIDRRALPPRAASIKATTGKASILHKINEWARLDRLPETFWDELRATYYGSCARVDHQLGLIVEALKGNGWYDDTALFFFSDHGDFTGDYDLVEKTQNTFEDCLTRVPFVYKPPASSPCQPGVRDALIELIDLSATIYDLLDVDPGYDHFGKSLNPLLCSEGEHRTAVFCEGGRRPGEGQASDRKSQSAKAREGLYFPRVEAQLSEEPLYHTQATMCRTRKWKYVHRQFEQDELYDMENDPLELNNRIHDPACASIIAELRLKLLDWYQTTADTVPQREDDR